MQPADIHRETSHEAPEERLDWGHLRTRLAWVLSAILLVLLLVIVPPLLNVSRFQRRIASNLSNSLGRPVHLDRVSLTLLPLPGFTLENFVVNEDPAFGYEPILRANEVRATVRISSLWSHHVEFSRISLTEPTSLNLVRLPDGRWNFEPVLLQASRIEAAPTAQTFSGSAPRFPYIEASGARINLKLGQEKTPYALTDSDFALWLPSPRQWHFRLQAHPARTDVAPSDAGVLRLEGTLGDSAARATTLAQVPIDLHAVWGAAPVAGLSRIALGRDIGLRGELTVDLDAVGTVDSAQLAATISLAHGRRADFIPSELLSFEANCKAREAGQFQSFTDIECRWPPAVGAQAAMLQLAASVPDVRDVHSASAEIALAAVPAPVLLEWLQAATPHPPTSLVGTGVLAGSLAWHPTAQPAWTGDLALSGESLQLPGHTGSNPIPLGDVSLRSAGPATPRKREGAGRVTLASARPSAAPAGFDLQPLSLPLGGRQPAVLEGHFDGSGYSLHLAGSATMSRLLDLADSTPQFGEGLRELLAPETIEPTVAADAIAPHSNTAAKKGAAQPADEAERIDFTATRQWGQPQTWVDNSGTSKR